MLALALITNQVITQNGEKDSRGVRVDCQTSASNLLQSASELKLLSRHENRVTSCIFSGLYDLQPDVPLYGIHQRGVRISWR